MPDEIETTEEEMEVEYEPADTRSESIASCFNAISAVDGLDPMIKEDIKRVTRIRRRYLKILDRLTAEMYDEIFDDRSEEEE